MKKLFVVAVLFGMLGAVAAQGQEGPATFWQFNSAKSVAGQAIVKGFRIISIQELTREKVDIHVQTLIASTHADGYAVSMLPVEGYKITLTGDAFKAFAQGKPTEGLTREEDFMAAAYQAVVIYQLDAGKDWGGELKVASKEVIEAAKAAVVVVEP